MQVEGHYGSAGMFLDESMIQHPWSRESGGLAQGPNSGNLVVLGLELEQQQVFAYSRIAPGRTMRSRQRQCDALECSAERPRVLGCYLDTLNLHEH